MAPVGHTDWHGASSQCMHWVGTVSTLTTGLRTALEFVGLDQRDIGGQVVLVLTRNAACLAADALRRVDEHSITSH